MKTLKFFLPLLASAALLIPACSDNDSQNKRPERYTVVLTAENGVAIATVDKLQSTEIVPGSIVELSAIPSSRYEFDRWTVLEGDVQFTHPTANPATFMMPPSNVKINAVFKKRPIDDVLAEISDPAFRDYIIRYMNNPQHIDPDTSYPAWDTNGDGKLSVQEAAAVRYIYLMDSYQADFKSLEGIDFFTGLQQLTCISDKLTNIDLKENKELTHLTFSGSGIKNIDLRSNVKLKVLNAEFSGLQKLDLSANVELIELRCGNTALTDIDVSKNTQLRLFSCSNNGLKKIDISANPDLVVLYCQYNELTSLDLNNNTKLEYIYCANNPLSSLDVSLNTRLTELYCNDMKLTELILTKNTGLRGLDCSGNLLTSLDVRQNPELERIGCSSNELTSLELNENNRKISSLYCYNNRLTSLNASYMAIYDRNQYYLYCGNQQQTLKLTLRDSQLSYWNWTLKFHEDNANVELQ